jgi:hypothetical protein
MHNFLSQMSNSNFCMSRQELGKLCQSWTNVFAIQQSDGTWQNTKYTEDVSILK